MKKTIESVFNPPLERNGLSLKVLYGKNKSIYYYSLARHALKEGLFASGIKANDSILVPSFICRDVLAPFNELNLKVIFYDVNIDLTPKGSVDKYPKANAILMVHYFGLENNVSFFQKYCELNNALLVEDNAHGLLSRNQEGLLLGTIGDIGIISVRKTLPIVNGAMLIFKKNKIMPEMSFQNKFDFRLTVKNFIRPFVAKFGFKPLMKFSELKRIIRKHLKGTEFPISTFEEEKKIPLSKEPCDFDLYFSKINIAKEVNRRRDLFYLVKNLLKNEKIIPVKNELSSFEVPYMYPFYTEKDEIEKIKMRLKNHGLELIQWPALPKDIQEMPHDKFYDELYLVKFLW